MNTQELKNIVDRLKSYVNENEAYFGFFQYGGGQDESFIKANKEGLIRFATELLEANLAASTEEYVSGEKQFYSLSSDWFSEHSEFNFSYVELLQKLKADIEPDKEYRKTWKDKLSGYVFGGIIIFILISILVGAITIISWLF
ncbi:hypothetical protein [Olleya sp. YS]|uniref:hypothetical protein n=1 Tax=Olleya sp. YS TaxID=3028318 RepID=UPI0024344DDD|nr:hypothetical protein [Olleya sp. YS]WGD35883.1 hypothetical protein Ollyesu_05570 [Olleya sp. YS]